MHWYLLAAALLAATGLVHSVMGQRMILRPMRAARTPYAGILWATWHLVTLTGLCIASVLVWLAQPAQSGAGASVPAWSIIAAMLAGSATVFFGTKGRHPGSIALLGVAILTWLGMH